MGRIATKCNCPSCQIGAKCRNYNQDGSKTKWFAVVRGSAFITDYRDKQLAIDHAKESDAEVVEYYPAESDG